ncbi:Uncharacterised protein [Clostridium sporogenes]|nr:hypothetical protein [Clostridium sporogenes]SUY94556.1 Uncharacterised protein [Clostridium sporogenes]
MKKIRKHIKNIKNFAYCNFISNSFAILYYFKIIFFNKAYN